MIQNATPMPQGGYECKVVNCARCGSTHPHVLFKPFANPPPDTTHWAICPTLGEPILFQVKRGPVEAVVVVGPVLP